MENIYNQHKELFIARNGQNKFDTLYRKISNSKLLAQLEGQSIHGGITPSAGDFLIIATSSFTSFFGFNTESKRMGALIALKIWDKVVNQVYRIASSYDIQQRAIKIINN